MKDSKDCIVVTVTASSEAEAAEIAGAIVKEGLAACCNIVARVRSIYTWKGELRDEAEALCVFKTRASLFERLKKRVVELHSYELPEVVAIKIDDGLEPYLAWIFESTHG